MPVVTSIEKLRFKRRADVWLDGQKAFALGIELIATAGLRTGSELSDAELNALRDQDERHLAVDGALRLLSMGPKSERDLRQRLRRRGLGRPAVDAAVGRMRELGYIDDAAFARSYVESRLAATPRSRRSLAFELGQKGVQRELSDAALAGISDDDAAYEAAQRRLRSFSGLDRKTFERRLGSFLASRGFGYGVARATVQRCWSELQAGDAE
jgi:regulatory protein